VSWSRALLVAAILLAGCSQDRPETGDVADGPTAPAADCSPDRIADPGATTRTLTSEGVERSFILHVPRRYDGRAAVPLVLNFHGFGSNAGQQMAYSLFASVADTENFLVAAPEGQGTPSHFNFRDVPPGETDDVMLATDLVDRLVDELCVDRDRIYVAGMSNGGVMAFAIACRAADRFAAFGAVAALVWAPECSTARPVPVIGFAGTDDRIVPFEGGEVACCGRPRVPPATETMANWATHNRCEATPRETEPAPRVRLLRYEGCAPGSAVDFYVVEGGGHDWPGAPLTGATSINATTVLWRFFAQHERGQSHSRS
jgi:polyhydroxybutyrate depolymerase